MVIVSFALLLDVARALRIILGNVLGFFPCGKCCSQSARDFYIEKKNLFTRKIIHMAQLYLQVFIGKYKKTHTQTRRIEKESSISNNYLHKMYIFSKCRTEPTRGRYMCIVPNTHIRAEQYILAACNLI